MEDGSAKLRWGAEQRLEFIEFRLFWEGTINRSDITERFDVSVPQASNDLTLYRQVAPGNIDYDASAKRYVARAAFRPRFLKPNPDRYLAQLKALSDGILELDDTWISSCPNSGVLPIPSRRMDPDILRAVLKAVRDRRALHIQYQSMSQPDPQWRWISPHAFGFDGLRWHARAYCHRRRDFVDFVIGRFLATGETSLAEAYPEDDWRWTKHFGVILRPNPRLTAGQRRAIALDYGMSDDRIVVPVRYALLYYFDKRLRLDVATHLDDARECPIVVENRELFDAALADAKAKSVPVKSKQKIVASIARSSERTVARSDPTKQRIVQRARA